MIETKLHRAQVLVVILLGFLYLLKYVFLHGKREPVLTGSRGNEHGPALISKLSSYLTGTVTIWQVAVALFLWLYFCRNFATITCLECPEPLIHAYTPGFFQATQITTALDAGFWTAMSIKPKWLCDIASLVFSMYYLFALEQAEAKVRQVRSVLTVEHLRVSWNKATTPYLSIVAKVRRPRLTSYPPRPIQISRPQQSSYKEPVNAWLYFDGPLSALENQTCVVLDFPGGGFVALSPRDHDDRLLAWAGKLKVPVVSLDYKKAPEYPYPHALHEGYDTYQHIIATNGRCLGLSGRTCPRIILTGDSAGGNLAVGVTLMTLTNGLPRPNGLFLAYPCLNMKGESWLNKEQMEFIQGKCVQRTNRNVLWRKKMDFYGPAPLPSPSPSLDGDGSSSESSQPDIEKMYETYNYSFSSTTSKSTHARFAVSSALSYANDRILTPEIMRTLIILYIGPKNQPNFNKDYFLSPILAPESLLAQFPKTYFLTGERDPLVDDTMIFAGCLRQAKLNQFLDVQDIGLVDERRIFDEKDHMEVSLLPGISHGFFQMVSFFPEGWRYVHRSVEWIREIFERGEVVDWKGVLDAVPQAAKGFCEKDAAIPMPERKCSVGSLYSEEDILDRRMNELTGGLMC